MKDADFSLEFMASSWNFFYVEGEYKSSSKTFTLPYRTSSWISVTTYVILLMSGLVIVNLVTEKKKNDIPYHKNCFFRILQREFDFVLRSLIAKRQTSEPFSYSARIAFSPSFVLDFLYLACTEQH